MSSTSKFYCGDFVFMKNDFSKSKWVFCGEVCNLLSISSPQTRFVIQNYQFPETFIICRESDISLFRDTPGLSDQFDEPKIPDGQIFKLKEINVNQTLNAYHHLKHDSERLRNETNAYYSKERAILAGKAANICNKKENFKINKPLSLIEQILAKVLKLFRGK